MLDKNSILQYLNRASLIPVGRDKKPLIAWKEFQTRKPTKEEVLGWFEKWPEMNIGIVTGKISNFAVVDVEKGGSTHWLPETLKAKTGGGGWHYYYQYCEGIENKARIRPLTDIRGEGGFVVAPPSIHQSGVAYEWVNAGQIEPQPFPKHLFGVKETKWDDLAGGVPQGQRNETATKYIGKLMSMFSPDTWEKTVWETAKLWNQNNSPSLPENELRNTYESIKRRAIKNPRSETIAENIKFITFTEVLARAKKELLNTKPEDIISFGYDFLDEKMTGLFRGELVVIGGETGSGKTVFATNIIYRASLKNKCAVFALEDRLEDYGIKRFYFEIGRIKRSNYQPNYDWNTYRKNVISDRETFEREMDEAEANLKNDNIFFAVVEKQMDIDILEEMIEQQVANGVSLFLIDHLHYFDLLKGSSSKADYIESLMVRLKTIQNKTGARILLVVHYRKLDGKKPSLDSFKDSISIVQNANYVISLYRDRTNTYPDKKYDTTFFISKSRNPNGEGNIEVVFDPEINDYKTDGEWSLGNPTDSYKEFNPDQL